MGDDGKMWVCEGGGCVYRKCSININYMLRVLPRKKR